LLQQPVLPHIDVFGAALPVRVVQEFPDN